MAKILFAQTAKGQDVLTNDKALVERLRSGKWLGETTCGPAADRIEAQAAEIEELKSWKAAEEADHHKLRAEIERLREALVTVRARIEDIENPFEDGTRQEHTAFEKAVDAAQLIAMEVLGQTV